MLPDELPTGALLTRERKGGRFIYEAKWRDSTRTQRKKMLGRAWLERDSAGNLVKPRGRVKPGFLDERRAHVEMARVIKEHQEELDRQPLRPHATFANAVHAWLDYLEHEKRAKPATMRGYQTMVCSPMPSRPRGKPRKARIMRAFGSRRLTDITTGDVNRFLAGLDQEAISARQVNMHRQVLHSIFEFAKRPDTFGLKENPAPRIEPLPIATASAPRSSTKRRNLVFSRRRATRDLQRALERHRVPWYQPIARVPL